MIVGHKETLDNLPDPMPPVLLLLGPEGVGKRRVAKLLARATQASIPDFQSLHRLTAEKSRALVQFHQTAPVASAVKASLFDLTGSSMEAVNGILKTLEEPMPYSRFIIHSDTEPPLTIISRCFVLRFGTLSVSEVEQVLRALRCPELHVAPAAQASQGRVSVALAYVANHAAGSDLEELVKAFAKRSGAALEQALTNVTSEAPDEHTGVLCTLLAQSIRNSLTSEAHEFSEVSVESRLAALALLGSASRPNLRLRGSMWHLALGV